MLIYQRTSPRGTGTRSSEQSEPSRRRVARAGVRDAGGRRRTSPKNHLKTNFLFASTFIMFARGGGGGHQAGDEVSARAAAAAGDAQGAPGGRASLRGAGKGHGKCHARPREGARERAGHGAPPADPPSRRVWECATRAFPTRASRAPKRLSGVFHRPFAFRRSSGSGSGFLMGRIRWMDFGVRLGQLC